jgi:acyl-CoA thioester hydrolase
MNVRWYVGKFDEASWYFFSMLGITPSFLRESGRGMAALEQRLSYKQELYPGDVVFVRSRLDSLDGKKIHFTHEMNNGETDKLVATCEFLAVHMDTTARKSIAFSNKIVAKGKYVIENQPT